MTSKIEFVNGGAYVLLDFKQVIVVRVMLGNIERAPWKGRYDVP